MPLDKVTLQILANHCSAAAESMANTLLRTAHSTFVKETEDFTTGLVTPDGKTFASPYELGVTWFVGLDYGQAIRFIDSYEDGDIAITNDPYSGFVCTHSPDTHLWKPVFYDGELVCFSVTHIHNTDVGGAVPASLSRTLTEVHQEGVRLPPVKLFKRGELNREVRDIMLANVRMPEQNWGDMKAQVACVNTGDRKVHEMIARFGIDTFRHGIVDLLDHGEAQARRVIREIPDGDYFFADYTDEDSIGGHPCRIALNLIVKGDELVFDFSQSDPQLNSSLNIPTGGNGRHAIIMVATVYILGLLDRKMLLNFGILRPIQSILPKGSMLNPEFPAAVGMRTLTTLRLQSVIFGAFAQALPGRIPAACGDGGPLLNLRTTDNRTGRKVMANLNPISGGGGATSYRDGTDGSGANFGFLKNTPIEISEAEVPVKILGYGLAQDFRRCRQVSWRARHRDGVRGAGAAQLRHGQESRSLAFRTLGFAGRTSRQDIGLRPQPRQQPRGGSRQYGHLFRRARRQFLPQECRRGRLGQSVGARSGQGTRRRRARFRLAERGGDGVWRRHWRRPYRRSGNGQAPGGHGEGRSQAILRFQPTPHRIREGVDARGLRGADRYREVFAHTLALLCQAQGIRANCPTAAGGEQWGSGASTRRLRASRG